MRWPCTGSTQARNCRSRLAVDRADGGNWAESEEDAAYLESIVRSVVAGQVEEVFGPGDRSRVTVTLADGTKDAGTGFVGLSGCLPRPGWKRLGRHIQYQPWDG